MNVFTAGTLALPAAVAWGLLFGGCIGGLIEYDLHTLIP